MDERYSITYHSNEETAREDGCIYSSNLGPTIYRDIMKNYWNEEGTSRGEFLIYFRANGDSIALMEDFFSPGKYTMRARLKSLGLDRLEELSEELGLPFDEAFVVKPDFQSQ